MPLLGARAVTNEIRWLSVHELLSHRLSSSCCCGPLSAPTPGNARKKLLTQPTYRGLDRLIRPAASHQGEQTMRHMSLTPLGRSSRRTDNVATVTLSCVEHRDA